MTTSQTSAGHVLSNEAWLDTHAAACAREYRDFVQCAGFETGWSVLDAGSGSGSFVSFLREAVGIEGRVVCIDLASENCRLSSLALGAANEVTQGSVTRLPFASARFDAAWCANTFQYLTAEQVEQALAELRRVVRPGGRVAVKDVDMLAFKVSPADAFLFPHLAESCLRAPDASPDSEGSLRGRELRRWLERAGFIEVQQHSLFIERWAPLTTPEVALWSCWLSYLAALALNRDVPAPDRIEWREIARDGGVPFVTRPDFYGCEAQAIAIGTVPEGS
jgi:SAM-dependent methyltransferase